jgi:hypothetical protein
MLPITIPYMLRISTRGMREDFFIELKRACSSILGGEIEYDFNNASNQHSDVHFEVDYSKNTGQLPGNLNVLILWEPRSVVPWTYKNEYLKKFQLIIPISPWRADNLGLKNWILHPVKLNQDFRANTERSKTVVMINSAKFSAHRNSLYGFRRKISRALFEEKIDYELKGMNWKMSKVKELRERIWAVRKELQSKNIPSLKEAFSGFFYKYPEYKGEVTDKIIALSEYRYSIIIENEADFISEKLIDSILAKTVPIYIGPSLEKLAFLSRCVYQCEPEVQNILKILKDDDSNQYLEKIKNINELDMEDLKIFTENYNCNKLISITKAHLINHVP